MSTRWGLDTKTYWLTGRQSQCDFEFDFDYEWVLKQQLEKYELVLRQSLASKNVNTEAEEATALEAVTRWQPMKIQQTGKT
jgi:hypothetical protein